MKVFIVIVQILVISLISTEVIGQDKKPSHVQFHGSNTLFGQYSNMQGIGSEIPPSFFRNDLQMTLTVYDIPISASFFITSMERDYRQSINNFRIYFDVKQLLKNKGLGNPDDIIKSAALSSVKSLETITSGLESSKDLLDSDLLNCLTELEPLEQGYDSAVKGLVDAKLGVGEEDVAKAQVKVDEAKGLMDKVQHKSDSLKSKLDELQTKLDNIMTKLDQAKAKYEEVKSLVFDSKAAERKAMSFAKKSVMSKFSRFLANFTTLEIGKCRPNYSDLTLKGIPVSGVNIEFTPGNFYVAFSTGKTLRSIEPDSSTLPVYEQKLLFGKMGVGKKQGTHFYLTYLQVADKENSLPPPSALDSIPRLKPRSNHVIGTELKLAFFKKKLTIEGEGAVSLITRDTQAPEIPTEDSGIPSWIADIFKPNISSSIDYAYDVKANLVLKTTRITGGMSMVGPGFYTLGNPNLRNDRLTYHGKIDQTFAKKQVSVSVFYKRYIDNLICLKRSRSTTVAYGITAGLRFRKLPYLMVTVTPNFMNSTSDSLTLSNSVWIMSAMTGYDYRIGKMRSNTSFSFFYQNTESILDTIMNNSMNQSYTLNQMLTFKIPLSLTAGATYTKSEYRTEKQNIWLLTLSGTLSAFKNKWQNSLGVKYSNQGYEQDKLGFFLNSRAQLGKMFELEIRIEDNIYRDNCFASENFNEFIATSSLIMKW